MKRSILYILLLIPIIAWAASTTIFNAGNWNDSGNWNSFDIGDTIDDDVVISSDNLGTIIIQNLDNYTIRSLDMKGGNTLTIDPGGSLKIGSVAINRSLDATNNTTLNINGRLEIWGDFIVMNNLVLNVTGVLIVHGNLDFNDDAVIDIQGSVTVDGDFIGKENNNVNVDGLLEAGNISMGNTGVLTGTGTINLTGSCTSPNSFCSTGPLDITDPVISNCPVDISVSLTGVDCDEVVNWTAPTASDNVSVASFTSTHYSGDAFPVGITTVTYTATDDAGNMATCTFNVTVTDNTPPVISNCPADIVVSVTGGNCDEIVNWVTPTAADNCSVASFNSTHNSGDIFLVGTTVVSYITTDAAGNGTTCTFNVTVNEDTDPVINGCPADIVVSLTGGSCDAIVNWVVPTASDNCSVASFNSTHNSGDTFQVGTTVVSYIATDATGNGTTCTFSVTVNDDTDPVIANCPTDIAVSVTGGTCDEIVNWIAPTATDNCSITSFNSTHNPGDAFPVGITTVTYTAIDPSGNEGTCTFNVTVTDNTPPVISNCPADIVVSVTGGTCDEIVNWIVPTAADNCSVVSYTSTHNSGDTFPVGITTVTYTATDVAGNTATCSFNVTVTDNTPPVITNCPADIEVSLTGGTCDEIVNWVAPTAADNCTVASYVSTHNPGDVFPVGITTVTYTATDVAGNIAICTFNVTVTDDTDPVITACPADIVMSLTGSTCDEIVNWIVPTAADNCSVASFTSTHNSGDTFLVGITTVTYTATDVAGNIATCSFNVTVTDDTDPVITACPVDIVVSVTGGTCDEIVNWIAPTAADNCSVASFTSKHNSGDTFPVGITTVTYTATDVAGNIATCSFNVTVTDDTDPVITTCPVDIVVSLTGGTCDEIVNWIAPTAADNCSVASFTSTHNSGDTFPVGITMVTYTATDVAGNMATCSFNVTVTDNTPPVISNCPADIVVSLTGGTCDEIVNWVAPTVTDNCSVASFTSTNNSGDTFPVGITTVTYTATDAAGHMAICTFNVTVTDNTPPIISNCPADIVVSLTRGTCDEIVNWVAPTVTDNCSVASFNSTHNSGDTFPIGTTVVSYIATDPAGLSDICTFNVTVNDITPPVFNFCPTLVNIATFDVASQTAVVTWQNPTAIDNCGVPIVTSNFSSGDSFPPGLTTVIYTATDGSGKTDTCEFPVDVLGNKAPKASPTIVDAFSGQPIEICLDVRDEDGDVLIVEDIDDNNLNGVIEGSGSVANLCFIYTSFDDFVGEEVIIFAVCDNGTPIACINVEVRFNVTLDLRLTIYKAFTPDGDNINDVWEIENIQNYPNNQVMIYDRLGGLIFSAQGYNNESIVWDGRSNQNGQNILPSGTYFYKIDLGREIPIKKGFIELVN